MSTKALKSQLLAAVAMVLVSSIALGSSTFAWFAINNNVTATGMSVTTQVSNNLLIAPSSLDQTAHEAEDKFKTSLIQDVSGTLEPVSTVDGVNFWWTSTKNVKGNGDATSDAYTQLSGDGSTDAAFKSNYEVSSVGDAKGYVDYVFQLKAINTKDSTEEIKLTAMNLVYGGTQTVPEKAFRAAIFVDEAATFNNGVGTLKNILRDATSKNFSQLVSDDVVKAVTSGDALGTVVYNGNADANIIAKVNPHTTAYYKVVVRLWLEGEDSTCNNSTFAPLTSGKWALDLKLVLGGEEAKISAMTQKNVAITDLSSDTVSGTTVVIDGVTYYQLTTNDTYYSNTTPFASTSHVYTMVNNHPIDVTNQCKLPTT